MTDLILQQQWQIDKGEPPTNLARLLLNGALLLPGALSSVIYAVYELADSDPAVRTAVAGASGSLTASNVVLDPAITGDERWPYTEGYNFRHQVSWTQVAGRLYLVEYTLTPTVGLPLIKTFRYRVL